MTKISKQLLSLKSDHKKKFRHISKLTKIFHQTKKNFFKETSLITPHEIFTPFYNFKNLKKMLKMSKTMIKNKKILYHITKSIFLFKIKCKEGCIMRHFCSLSNSYLKKKTSFTVKQFFLQWKLKNVTINFNNPVYFQTILFKHVFSLILQQKGAWSFKEFNWITHHYSELNIVEQILTMTCQTYLP